jgi:hypothetical protein
MTAAADRYEPGRSREELRVVELASGLLMLLDAYRLTGRLPLEVQVQASRLRHAVKLAVQAEAARTATLPPPPPLAASGDQAAALRAWIAAQPWVQPGPVGLGVSDALLVVNRPGGPFRRLGVSAPGRGRPRGR